MNSLFWRKGSPQRRMIPPVTLPSSWNKSPFPLTIPVSLATLSLSLPHVRPLYFTPTFLPRLLTVLSTSSCPVPLSSAFRPTVRPVQQATATAVHADSLISLRASSGHTRPFVLSNRSCSHFMSPFCFLSPAVKTGFPEPATPLCQQPSRYCPDQAQPRLWLPFTAQGLLGLSPCLWLTFAQCHPMTQLRLWKSSHLGPLFPGSTFPTEGLLLSRLHSCWPPAYS